MLRAQGCRNLEVWAVTSTVSATLRDNKIMESANLNGDEKKRKRLREAVYKEAKDIPITAPMLLKRAKDFAFLLDYPDFRPGDGWLY